jgi:peptidoglycan/LPS O-acetylase OafA/YrhL
VDAGVAGRSVNVSGMGGYPEEDPNNVIIRSTWMLTAPTERPPQASSVSRILPISSIRFILAMWVVVGHFSIPVLIEQQHGVVLQAARFLRNNAINGPAAVIVFFVISGFCIHFPNRAGLRVRSWKAYYARRYLRILIPMTVAVLMALPLKMQFGLFTDSILWSLLCEEIYYLIYPLLLLARDRIGWRNLMAIAWVGAFLTLLTNPHAMNYPSYGPQLNWVLGLPCWLLGCKLAERFDASAASVSGAEIWMWRGGVWAVSMALSGLAFHTRLHYPWTLNLFALLSYFWLEREIRYYRDPARRPVFESLGEASYSIYLIHTHVMWLLLAMPFAAGMSPQMEWVWHVLLLAVVAPAFYFLVERPSHRFARAYAKRAAWLRGSE